MAASGEWLFPANPPALKPVISRGLPFQEACVHHSQNSFRASRIYVVVSSSISKTENFKTLQSALGDRVAGVRYGFRPHTPWDDVLEVARDLGTIDPDLIITLGAGSITDGIKVASFAYSNGALTTEDLERLAAKTEKQSDTESDTVSEIQACRIPVINVPTSLSGGEYTAIGGATDTRNGHKATFRHPSMMASLVVLDPRLCTSTPERVWLSSGVRAVDHCVEGISGTASSEADEERKLLEHSLRTLLPNLLATKANPGDLQARVQSMLAVPPCLHPCLQPLDVGLGASHGIGHQLGPLGVGHGETSCVLLPVVLKFNYLHGDAEARSRQKRVWEVFWSDPTVSEVLMGQGLTKEDSDTGDVVGAFIKALGMPTSLRAVGVGREKFDSLADNALKDFCTQSNPVALDKKGVLEILEMAAAD